MAWGSGRGSDKAVSPHGLDVPFTTIKSSCHYDIIQDEMEAGGAGATARGSDAQIAGVQSGRPGQIQVMLVIIGKIISGAALDRPLVLVEKDQADTDQRHADRDIEDHGLRSEARGVRNEWVSTSSSRYAQYN